MYRVTYDFEIQMPDGQRKVFKGQTREQALALGIPVELLEQLELQHAVRERAFVPDNRLN